MGMGKNDEEFTEKKKLPEKKYISAGRKTRKKA